MRLRDVRLNTPRDCTLCIRRFSFFAINTIGNPMISLFRTTSLLALIAPALMPSAAHADCREINLVQVLCDGGDGDGFVTSNSVSVQVVGSVIAPFNALELLGPNPSVFNMGTITGNLNGIFAPSGLSLQNSGTVTGGGGAAIATLGGADVNNIGGTILGLAGPAITSAFGLTLDNNIAGEIRSIGAEATVVAGLGATITNSSGSEITATTGTAIEASQDLTLTNTALISTSGDTATIDAGWGATITNGIGGQITARFGSAIEADVSLVLTNQDLISAQGPDAAVDAGVNARITNQAGGEIVNRFGPAIEARTGMRLTNGFGAEITGGPRRTIDAGVLATITNRGAIVGLGDAISFRDFSRLNNATFGLIEANLGSAVVMDGDGRLTNDIGAEILSRGSGDTISLRNADSATFNNRGEIRSFSGSVLDVRNVVGFRFDNRDTGELVSRFGDGIVINNTDLADLRNAGTIRAQGTAIHQRGGLLDLRNSFDGEITSAIGAAVIGDHVQIDNDFGALIQGVDGALAMSYGTVENEGTIEARGVGPAIVVDASFDPTSIVNTGTIAGATGIQFDDDHSGTRSVTNSGTISAFDGIAVDFGAGSGFALGQSTLSLAGESRIFGDVTFGASDDLLEIFDITSGQLTDGLFDGGDGIDRVMFGSGYLMSDFISFIFPDAITMDIAFRSDGGDLLSGTFCAFRDHPITGSDNIRSVIPI